MTKTTERLESFRFDMSAEESAMLRDLASAGGVSRADTLRLLLRDAAKTCMWRLGTTQANENPEEAQNGRS